MARLASALAVAVFVVVAVRTAILAVPFMNPDNLAYLAWGAELRELARPTLANALTTPHPVPIALMAAVGAILTPLATWAVVAAVGLAASAAGAAVLAWRHAGAQGVGVTVLALGLSAGIWGVGPLRGIDWLAAGLVGVALALPPERRRLRLVALVAAGLVRPEVWLLPPLLAYGERRDTRAALLWGAAAPLLWLAFDAALFGDPLVAFNRTDELARIAAPGPGFGDWLELWIGVPGIVVLAVGWVGAWRVRDRDLLPGLVLATVPLALLAEFAVGYPVRERFALVLVPAAAGAAGCALRRLAGPLGAVVATACAIAGIVVAQGRDVADRRLDLGTAEAQAAAMADIPRCARIGVTGLGPRTPGLLPPLAVVSGRPLSAFVAEPAAGEAPAVLAVGTPSDLPELARGDGWVLGGREPYCASRKATIFSARDRS